MTQGSLISFDAETQSFHLHNDEISYVPGIEDGGVLAHLYFGRRIKKYHGQLKSPRIDRGFSGNLRDPLTELFRWMLFYASIAMKGMVTLGHQRL